jgi:carbonic anhydrase
MNQISRRDVLKNGAAASFLALLSVAGLSGAAFAARPDGKVISPAKALDLIKRGNARWAAKKPVRANYAPKGQTLEAGQWPIAAILGCADSRVQPDELFDVVPANLFVVRNAGNVVDDDVLGSLEYAVEHLGVGVIVALGHQSCGAVKAADAAVLTGAMPGGHIDAIVNKISPAIKTLPAAHTIDQAVHVNAVQSAKELIALSPILEEAEKAGKLIVVSGEYSLHTKKVTFSE